MRSAKNIAKRERKRVAKVKRILKRRLIKLEVDGNGGVPPPKEQTYNQRNIRLKAMGYETYADYLASDLWRSIRQRVFALYGDVCRLCQQLAEHVHHLGYGKHVLAGISLTQLVPLCGKCHREVEFDGTGRKRTLVQTHTAYVRKWKALSKEKRKIALKDRICSYGYCKKCGKKARKGSTYCRPCSRGPK